MLILYILTSKVGKKVKIQKINLEEYNYNLPKEKIALFPLEERDKSKLLVAYSKTQKIIHSNFFEIDQYIPEGSLILVNSTKVIHARIFLNKSTGGKVELLCVHPLKPSIDPQLTMQTAGKCVWNCIVGGRNVRENMVLKDSHNILTAKILSRKDNYADVEFSFNPDNSFAEVLSEIGKIPLPPYINRDASAIDEDRYQTVYSRVQGSVAAPTAGLHFTDRVIDKLKAKNVIFDELILHVGPGTFVPIDKDVEQHDMHEERFFVSSSTIENIISNIGSGAKIIATGTTTLRTLETLYWIGVKSHYENYVLDGSVFLNQFEPYELSEKYPEISFVDAFTAILKQLQSSNTEFITGTTKLFIVPGYQIKTADALITNFHLPKSTLILLVSAFIGEFWQEIYNEALAQNYRFLSYGDSSLLIRF